MDLIRNERGVVRGRALRFLASRRFRLIQAKVRSTTPPQMDREAGLVDEFADDLNGDGGGIRNARAVVGAVGEDALHKGMPPPRLSEKRHRAITILQVGWVNEQFESAAIGIDHGVALAPNDFLAGIIALRVARFGGLHSGCRSRRPMVKALDRGGHDPAGTDGGSGSRTRRRRAVRRTIHKRCPTAGSCRAGAAMDSPTAAHTEAPR